MASRVWRVSDSGSIGTFRSGSGMSDIPPLASPFLFFSESLSSFFIEANAIFGLNWRRSDAKGELEKPQSLMTH